MTSGIRQTLDKYELIEKVGQGGMAIVYRGLDTTLRRQVAVKVLHRHLAEHQEARERFEREAQAVAKLHHENILEIFDFSGVESDESYIVTEFIDGQTLKQFMTEHPIRYPEVGAMITVQICRALGHAHSLGVLHRDVKPENVMIRNDGVVKLMDFGIAQMLDHQRLTVTGQLLGSPAYMSPEHVQGGKLDFRTDVFAAGIVLYQLATGELPFRGKNPHEILKRIAESSYTDPRQMNPLIGNELGAIIRKALAHAKDDRYADVSQMVAALEGYLAGSGLGNPRDELARFFNAPASYEMALTARLVAALTKRGLARLAEDRNAALEIFNRVLTMDPDNAEVLAAIERMSRQRRWLRGAAIGGGLIAVAVGGFFLREHLRVTAGSEVAEASAAPAELGRGGAGDRGPAAGERPPAASRSQTVRAMKREVQAGVDPPPERVLPLGGGLRRTENGADARPEAQARVAGARQADGKEADGAAEAGGKAPPRRTFTLTVYPYDAEYRIGDGAWKALSGQTATVEVEPGEVTLVVRKPPRYRESERAIRPDQAGGTIDVQLLYASASVRAACRVPGAQASVDGQPLRLDQWRAVEVDPNSGTRKIVVEFVGGATDQLDQHEVEVEAGERKDVMCRF
ncbi:MAG TPA: protein kinase [Candidatus Acidoferrum sp.]|nr:protein kinase [Candidatus Acidoferrum sp.]